MKLILILIAATTLSGCSAIAESVRASERRMEELQAMDREARRKIADNICTMESIRVAEMVKDDDLRASIEEQHYSRCFVIQYNLYR